jgi:hypothetical protein
MSKIKAIAITTPSNNDVLLEKGLRAQRHPGNIQYRNIIQEMALEYSVAEKRSVKDNIAHSIFNRVRGRFLTRESAGKYYVTSQEMVIFKMKQALRDRQRMEKAPKPASAATSRKNGGSRTSIAGGKDRKIKKNTDIQVSPLPLHSSSLSKASVLDKDMMKVLDIIKKL